jgi:hypothetical protein
MRPRVTTRHWLVVVAGVALAFSVWHELHYREQRELWSSRAGFFRYHARRHEHERDWCLQIEREKPYRGWADDAKDNEVAASQLRGLAEHAAEMKREAERHLIFP